MSKRLDLDAVVFDIGNVLLTFEPLEHLQKLYAEPLASRIHAAVYGSVHWVEMDRGVLTEEEIVARMAKDAPDVAGWIRPLLPDEDLVRPIPETIAYLPRLKEAGYRLYALSNYGAQRFDAARRRFPFFELFDGLLISGEEQLIKPQPAIYLLLLHRFGLVPERTLFVDDRKENIDGAAALGIQGMVFQRAEQLETLLA